MWSVKSTPAPNTTAKAFKKSVGLNGVGTKAVNALSEYFKVTAVREGRPKPPNSSSAT
jgi:DNA gyrase/topoisomerase IV subunit B